MVPRRRCGLVTRNKLIESENIAMLANLDLDNWPLVNKDSLTAAAWNTFEKRRRAVEMYLLNQGTLNEIKQLTGIAGIDVRRFVKRCLELDENGVVWGYRALIPQKKIKKYTRSEPSATPNHNIDVKQTGSFSQLLERYPSIKEIVEDYYFKRKNRKVYEPVIKAKHVHKRFLDACRTADIKLNEYPFNTKTQAKRSLERYLKELDSIYFSDAAKRHGEEAGRIATSAGIGDQNNPMIIRPFERVQFDGHLIDAMFTISFFTPEGDEITEVIDRIWILTIIDVATRAVVGYHISLNKEYNSFDVLRCIRNAIVPWKPMNLTIPGLKYDERGGLPSGKLKQTEWGLWSELYYDNGKANLANIVKEKLNTVVGCHINAGPVKTPERRGLLERFFGILEENGYHRLPSTTGNKPKDARRQNPEQKAKMYNISFNHLIELTDVLISNYNCTPHQGTNFLTPLETMEQRINRGMILRQLPEEHRSDLTFLQIKIVREVQGSVQNGRRPYIQYENVSYRSEVLSRTPDLIGTNLTLFINVEDLRVIKAFMPDGSEFGLLYATGKWGITPHSLEVRKQINRLRERKQIHFTSSDDPIEAYQKYLESNAKDKKTCRNRLINLERSKEQPAIIQPIAGEEQLQSLDHNGTDNVRKVDFKPQKGTRKIHKTIIY